MSTVCHLTALAALGFFSIAATRGWQGVDLLVSSSPGNESTGAQDAATLELATFEVPQDDESTAVGPVQMFEPSAVATSDLAPLDALTDISALASGVQELGLASLGAVAGRVRSDAMTGAATGDSPSASYATEFFGIGGSGRSFVYVVDCSGSMSEEGKFERARYELVRSLEQLSPDERYFVIFFNESAHPMGGNTLRDATDEQIERTRRWTNLVEPHGGTNPLPALLTALELQPDAIYFLSDGRFHPLTIQALRSYQRQQGTRVPIHTIAFVNRETQGLMRTIARHSGGEFRFVP